MIQDRQADNAGNPKSRRRVGYRIPATTNRLLLAAVTGLTSGLIRTAIDWLLHVLAS